MVFHHVAAAAAAIAGHKKQTDLTAFTFKGYIADGIGRYSELTFPDRQDIINVDENWPIQPFPGSLNININPDGFSKSFEKAAHGRGIQRLDQKILTPSFTIAHDAIGNNTIGPEFDDLDRGTMQLWRCEIKLKNRSEIFQAWAARRIGSAYSDVIEIMSGEKLRDAHNLQNGEQVSVTLFGKDAPAFTEMQPR